MKIRILALLIVVAVSIPVLGLVWFLFGAQIIGNNMDFLSEGKLIETRDSPDKKFTVSKWLCSGDLSPDVIRGAVKQNGTISAPKNIYWDLEEKGHAIRWIDSNKVQIGNVVLDVTKDRYDFRTGLHQ